MSRCVAVALTYQVTARYKKRTDLRKPLTSNGLYRLLGVGLNQYESIY